MTTKTFDHLGLSVVSLERSLEFYEGLLGMEIVERTTFDGELYEKILGVRGASGKVTLLRKGNLQIELFEFFHPSPQRGDPQRSVSDHGFTHFCLEVEDIKQDYERLKAAGVIFHCPPLMFFGTVLATYGRDPDGNVFELMQTVALSKPASTAKP